MLALVCTPVIRLSASGRTLPVPIIESGRRPLLHTVSFGTAQGRVTDRRARCSRRFSSGVEGPSADQAVSQGVEPGVAIAALATLLLGGLSVTLGLDSLFVIPLVLQGFFFLLASPWRTEKFYDASGALTHVALLLASFKASTQTTPRQVINCVLALVWCTRLGTFLFSRILRDKEDARFTQFKESFSTFSIPWSLQAVWVFLLQLPILIANTTSQPLMLGTRDVVGWMLWVTGFYFETVADAEKEAFRSDAANRGRYIDSGLWRYSRHPNYFGEILMWVGLCTSCSVTFTGWSQLGWLSPAFNTALLLLVSGVPLVEKAGEKKWGTDPSPEVLLAARQVQHVMPTVQNQILQQIQQPPGAAATTPSGRKRTLHPKCFSRLDKFAGVKRKWREWSYDFRMARLLRMRLSSRF